MMRTSVLGVHRHVAGKGGEKEDDCRNFSKMPSFTDVGLVLENKMFYL